MANPDLQADLDKTRATKGVLQSVLVWMNGYNDRLRAAVAAAMANGATAEELAPLTAEIGDTALVADQVAAAVAANP